MTRAASDGARPGGSDLRYQDTIRHPGSRTETPTDRLA